MASHGRVVLRGSCSLRPVSALLIPS